MEFWRKGCVKKCKRKRKFSKSTEMIKILTMSCWRIKLKYCSRVRREPSDKMKNVCCEQSCSTPFPRSCGGWYWRQSKKKEIRLQIKIKTTKQGKKEKIARVTYHEDVYTLQIMCFNRVRHAAHRMTRTISGNYTTIDGFPWRWLKRGRYELRHDRRELTILALTWIDV